MAYLPQPPTLEWVLYFQAAVRTAMLLWSGWMAAKMLEKLRKVTDK